LFAAKPNPRVYQAMLERAAVAMPVPYPPLNVRRRSALRLGLPLVLALLGFAALPLDLPLARWFDADRCPHELGRLLHLAEAYAHGFGVAAILITVVVLDWRRRALFPRALATVLGAGLTANLLKMCLSRARPHAFVLSGKVWETFGQSFPLNRAISNFESFPSAHMAAAVGLSAALIWLYPRGRWLFVVFALLAGGQRLYSMAHFLSDVVWGAAAGSFSASLFLPGGWLAAKFDSLEAYLAIVSRDRTGAGELAGANPAVLICAKSAPPHADA
jgi:membrane-associated phospholipid phosphatase